MSKVHRNSRSSNATIHPSGNTDKMIIDDYKMYSDYQWLMSYFQGSPKDQPGRPGFPGQALSRQLLIQQDNGLSGTAAAFCCDKQKFFVDNLRSFDVSICITHYGPLSSTINDTIWIMYFHWIRLVHCQLKSIEISPYRIYRFHCP